MNIIIHKLYAVILFAAAAAVTLSSFLSSQVMQQIIPAIIKTFSLLVVQVQHQHFLTKQSSIYHILISDIFGAGK